MPHEKDYINYTEFRRQFDKGTIRPIYLFQGQESFLIEEALEHVKQTLLPAAAVDFNYHKFSGDDAQIGDVLDQAQTIPFLSKWRVIILTDVDELSSQAQTQFISYLSNPNRMTCLILTAEKLDNRTKFAQTLKKHAEIVQFWKLYERDVPPWISDRTKQYGCTMALQAAAYLAELVGNDLRQLDNELKKIAAYSKTPELHIEAVQQVVGDIREHDIFDLVDAVGSGNILEALRILNQLLTEGEEPLKILAMVTRQFRLIWKVKAHLAEKKSLPAKDLASKIGVPFRTAEHLQKQAQRFSQVQIKQGFKRLCEVDRGLKSSTNSPKILLEDVLVDLCSPMIEKH